MLSIPGNKPKNIGIERLGGRDDVGLRQGNMVKSFIFQLGPFSIRHVTSRVKPVCGKISFDSRRHVHERCRICWGETGEPKNYEEEGLMCWSTQFPLQ